MLSLIVFSFSIFTTRSKTNGIFNILLTGSNSNDFNNSLKLINGIDARCSTGRNIILFQL